MKNGIPNYNEIIFTKDEKEKILSYIQKMNYQHQK